MLLHDQIQAEAGLQGIERKAEKMKKLWIFFLVLILTGCVSEQNETVLEQNSAKYVPNSIEIMNKRELWYDANDWFIMIETNEDLLGIYQGITPVEHVFCAVSDDIWKIVVETDIMEQIVTTWGECKDYVDCYIQTDVPDWTPVVIYEEEFDWGDRYDWK